MAGTRTRSPKHPTIPLEDALDGLQKVHKTHGFGELDRYELATALGFTSERNGAALRWLSSLRQFELVDQKGGGTCTISDLARDALFGSDAERSVALRRAINAPSIYKVLQDRFAGDELPEQRTLEAWLQRTGFGASAAPGAARVYLRSMEFVNANALEEEMPIEEPDEEAPAPSSPSSDSAVVHATDMAFGFSGALFDGNAFTFSSVRPMTEDDFEILEAMLAAQKMVARKRAPAEAVSGEENGAHAPSSSHLEAAIDPGS